MQRSTTVILAITLAIGTGVGIFYDNSPFVIANAAEGTSIYDQATVKQHATADDCWIIVHGKVYDVGSYIPSHPTAPSIISQYCGKDATQAFETKDKPRPREHSTTAWDLLDKYRIGELKQ